MTEGPFVSPRHTGRFLTPALKKQVELAHSENVPVFKHTDGNIWKIFDLIVETGINAIHPLDPIAGMDIGEAKLKYGDGLCLAGNVNCAATLSWATEEEVRQELRLQAVERIQRSLVLGKVAEVEGISVGEEDIDAEIERLAASAGPRGDEVRKVFGSAGGRQAVERTLFTRKTVERLVAIASGEGAPPPAEAGEEVGESEVVSKE